VTNLILLVIGLAAGVFAGMFGIGGGLIIVPALMFFLKVNPAEAIGTSLAALILPVGLLGAMEYYRQGFINVRFAALVALGLFAGAYFGARITTSLPSDVIRRIYGIFLLLVAARMLLAAR
jgi:uncharacterized membrane protein YfcA